MSCCAGRCVQLLSQGDLLHGPPRPHETQLSFEDAQRRIVNAVEHRRQTLAVVRNQQASIEMMEKRV